MEHGGEIDGLPLIANEMINNNPDILNIAILPNGVVQQIEPMAYNSTALGHDMFMDPERIHDADTARESGRLTVSGPYDLIQGDRGIISRLPLYQNNQFWGFVSIVYRFPALIENLLKPHYSLGILFQITNDKDENVIFGTQDPLPEDQIQVSIDIPNNQWFLKLAYKPAFDWSLVFKLAGSMFLFMLAVYLYDRLFKALSRQHDVIDSNNRLTALQSTYQQVMAQIGHDLRTPMQYILNEVRDGSLTQPRFQSPSSIIEENIRYQMVLVDQLLKYTSGLEKQRDIHPETGYLFHFMQQVRIQAESMVKEQGNCFQMEWASDLPGIVKVDFNQLQRILVNLLSNAAKFTKEGQITLSIGSLPAFKKQHHLTFRIQDEGPGMPEMDARGRHPKSGHGLGLVVVSDLLQQMGSALEYNNLPQGGALFQFELRLPVPEECPDPYRDSNVLDWDGSALNILLVEPHAYCANALAELLLGYGVEVFSASGLAEARALLERNCLDLVITEMDLPDGDGADLADLTACQTPVLLYGSRPAPAEKADKFAATLLRPADSAELLALVHILTGGNSG